MEAIKDLLQYHVPKFVIPLVVLSCILIAGLIAKSLLFRALRRWAAHTKTNADDIIIDAFSGPFIIWILMLSIFLATQSSELSENATAKISKILLILWIISLIIVASRLTNKLIKHYGRGIQGTLPVTSLMQNLARIIIFIIGILILMNQIGVSITPILTALGVGGLAVALALQDTLSNFFAGFYISLAGHIRLGDYIKLNSGEEGHVTDITWRSTTIKTGANNLIVIPNAKLAQAIITNFDLPAKEIIVRLPVSVSYDSDADEIERLLVDEAQKAAPEISGMLKKPEPFVRFIPGFGESSIDFTLFFWIEDFEQQALAVHEMRKRLFKRFREAGIEFPFPARTIYLHGESGAQANDSNLVSRPKLKLKKIE
jgi:small-conductance mechanosensitive channel